MTELKKHLRAYAEHELRLIGFMETEFGATCLKFLEELAEISGNDPASMKIVLGMVNRLIDQQPLSAITEEDFEVEDHTQGNETLQILRCTRYPSLYKKDGKYWDDRAIAFQQANSNPNERIYLYSSENQSKQEVTLPYFPNNEIKKL